MFIYTYLYIHTRVEMYKCVYIHIYTYIHFCCCVFLKFSCVGLLWWVHIHTYVYVYMCIYTYIHTLFTFIFLKLTCVGLWWSVYGLFWHTCAKVSLVGFFCMSFCTCIRLFWHIALFWHMCVPDPFINTPSIPLCSSESSVCLFYRSLLLVALHVYWSLLTCMRPLFFR